MPEVRRRTDNILSQHGDFPSSTDQIRWKIRACAATISLLLLLLLLRLDRPYVMACGQNACTFQVIRMNAQSVFVALAVPTANNNYICVRVTNYGAAAGTLPLHSSGQA